MLDRLRTHWTLVGLLALIGLQVWVQALWIRADGGIGEGVCCAFTAPVLEILLADGTDQLGWPWSHYRQSMGLLVWPALLARKVFGAHPDFLLWGILGGTVLCQGLLYDIGRRLAGGIAGLVAAGLYPMVPAVAYLTRRWDAMAPQHAVLVAALWFLLRSRGFSRTGWTVGFVLVAMVGCVLSARETDNLLFMAAIGAMAIGPALRGVLTGQGPMDEDAPGRLRCAIGAVAVGAVMAVFCVEYAFPLVDFGYFQDELGNQSYEQGASRISASALLAYPMRLYSDDLTPWLALPFIAALVGFIRRGPARAELLTWLLLPLLALGFVGKKNFYYAAVIYPVVPLIFGIAIARWRPERVRVPAVVALLLLAWLQWSARSLPTSTYPSALARVDWTGDVGPQAHLFQGVVPLNLGPRGLTRHGREIGLVWDNVTGPSCDCPQHLLVIGDGDFSDLFLQLKMRDPCLGMSMHPRIDHPDSVGLVLESPAECGSTQRPQIPVRPLRFLDQLEDETECIRLWSRTDGRLCGTQGSPPG